MRKRKENIILENISIETVAAEGKAIAHVDGKVLVGTSNTYSGYRSRIY